MRKLIVKYFALDYIVKLGSKSINFVRAANILFPLFCINGLIALGAEGAIYNSIVGILSLAILFIAIYLGFFYFQSNPVKFSELDDSQKWQFGWNKIEDLSASELAEWQNINSKKESYIYSPLRVLLLNIVSLVITLALGIYVF